MIFKKHGIESPIEQIKKEGFEEPESGEEGGVAVVSSKEDATVEERAEQMRKLGMSEEDLKNYIEEISKSDLERTIKANKLILLPESEMSDSLKNELKPGVACVDRDIFGLEGTEGFKYPVFVKFVDAGGNIAFSIFDAGQIKELMQAININKELGYVLNDIVKELKRILPQFGFECMDVAKMDAIIGREIQDYRERLKSQEVKKSKKEFDF